MGLVNVSMVRRAVVAGLIALAALAATLARPGSADALVVGFLDPSYQSQDNTGFREYELHVKDLRTGKTLADTVPKVIAVAWAKDNKTLFYTTPDAAKRSYRVYRHVVGEAAHDLLYEEKDERFSVYVSR